jgi:hypothetical protein
MVDAHSKGSTNDQRSMASSSSPDSREGVFLQQTSILQFKHVLLKRFPNRSNGRAFIYRIRCHICFLNRPFRSWDN